MTSRRWPLILLAATIGIAVVIFVVSGVSDPRTRSIMVDHFPELDVDDVEIDVATGLPIVPMALADGPWWWVEAPDEVLDARLRFASAAPISSAVDRAVLSVTLLARFPDDAAARSVAEALAAAVGDPAAEAAWLMQAGQAEGGSFEWLGSAATTAPFVQVVDRWLLVGGLAYRDPFDAWGTSPAGEPVYRSPLTLSLARQADSLLVEGDRSGEGVVAFDAICRGAPDELRPLSQDLADHGLQPGWQPPWIGPGITEEQRRARRTLRLVRRLQGAAFGRVLLEDPQFERLDRTLAAAADSGDADRMRAASDELSAHIARALPDELPDLGPVAAALDPEIVAAEVARYARFAVDPPGGKARPYVPPTEEERAEQARPYGASAASIPWRSGDAFFEVSLEGDEISLWSGTWLGIAEGFGPFVDYLATGGCTDLEVAFHDFDDVRGD